MKVSLKNKVVLVTGASSGIGALTARLLAERGAIPVLTARSKEKMEELASAIQSEHAVYPMDVRSEEQVAEVVSLARARYGRIDVLINNAGYGEFVPFAEAPLGHFEDMMDVNYMGTVRCAKAILPILLEHGDGHIVNVASLAGKMATAKSSGYAATKHAVLGLTNALRQELRGTGVFVSAVNPGPIDTPFLDRADPSGKYAKSLGRFLLKPEQVAEAIVSVVETRKAEWDMPKAAAAGIRLAQILPRWTEPLYRGWLNKK